MSVKYIIKQIPVIFHNLQIPNEHKFLKINLSHSTHKKSQIIQNWLEIKLFPFNRKNWTVPILRCQCKGL